MKVYELMSAIKEGNNSNVLQMNILKGAGLSKELSELINSLTGTCKLLNNANVEELKKWMDKRAETVSKAEALEKILKSYEEDEAKRITIQESLVKMQENIDKRNNANERYEAFSGINYIEETGKLIEQYGESVTMLNKLNNHLNDGRAEYHRCKAEHFSLLGEIESLKEKIDKLQHVDAEKGDMTLMIECMISVLRELVVALTSVHSYQGGDESSIETAALFNQFSQLVPMLEVKLRDYASVLPEKFMEEIKKIL